MGNFNYLFRQKSMVYIASNKIAQRSEFLFHDLVVPLYEGPWPTSFLMGYMPQQKFRKPLEHRHEANTRKQVEYGERKICAARKKEDCSWRSRTPQNYSIINSSVLLRLPYKRMLSLSYFHFKNVFGLHQDESTAQHRAPRMARAVSFSR